MSKSTFSKAVWKYNYKPRTWAMRFQSPLFLIVKVNCKLEILAEYSGMIHIARMRCMNYLPCQNPFSNYN